MNPSEDFNDVDNIAAQYLKKANDKTLEAEVKEIQSIDAFEKVRLNTYDFFTKTLESIASKEILVSKIDERINKYMDEHPLDFDQLMQLRRMYAGDSFQSRDSVLALFKPTPGSPSLMAEQISKKEEKVDKFDEMYEKMQASDLQKLDAMLRLVNAIGKKDTLNSSETDLTE